MHKKTLGFMVPGDDVIVRKWPAENGKRAPNRHMHPSAAGQGYPIQVILCES